MNIFINDKQQMVVTSCQSAERETEREKEKKTQSEHSHMLRFYIVVMPHWKKKRIEVA